MAGLDAGNIREIILKTFGTIAHDKTKRSWCLVAEPHVVMRLKRCFGKLDKSNHGKHYLSDTVENARDLEWFLTRYPLEGSPADLEYLAARAGEHKERESLVDAFSPLQHGKTWFYEALGSLGRVELRQGYETYQLREELGLKKSKNKMAERFDAHCVDSWVLANWYVGGHVKPDNERMLFITPLRFHRRQLHRLQPDTGGIRKPYGSTRSYGFKRGSLVMHLKRGLCYVGGMSKGRVSLHSLKDGRRITQEAKPTDVKFLAYSGWRWRESRRSSAPSMNHEVSLAMEVR